MVNILRAKVIPQITKIIIFSNPIQQLLCFQGHTLKYSATFQWYIMRIAVIHILFYHAHLCRKQCILHFINVAYMI